MMHNQSYNFKECFKHALVDEAVVRRTLGLIALVVIVVFVVAIFQRILLYWRYTVYTPRR